MDTATAGVVLRKFPFTQWERGELINRVRNSEVQLYFSDLYRFCDRGSRLVDLKIRNDKISVHSPHPRVLVRNDFPLELFLSPFSGGHIFP